VIDWESKFYKMKALYDELSIKYETVELLRAENNRLRQENKRIRNQYEKQKEENKPLKILVAIAKKREADRRRTETTKQ